jgi:transglutaminase-like putative cysteine protease
MVRVTTNDPNPFYLRFAVAEDVTSDGFVTRAWSQGRTLNSIPPPVQANGVTYRSYQAQVETIQFNGPVLPIYQQLSGTARVGDAWVYDERAGVVYSRRANANAKRYGLTYVRGELTPEALRTAPDLAADHPIRRAYTAVPEVSVVKETAQNLVKDKTTHYDKVRAIYDFFSPGNGFSYRLETREGNSGSVMVDFITEGGRQGYCEQYAAAMAWLVRAAGIPARVAFGWTRGNNRTDNTYTLTNANLHAWTEVFFDGYGWVPFDPTPASGVTGSVANAWAPDLTPPADPVLPPGGDDPPDLPGASGGAGAPATNQHDGDDTAAGGTADDAGHWARWPFHVLGVLVGLALVLMPALRRAALRRRRCPDSGKATEPPATVDSDGGNLARAADHSRARRDAHAAWDELIDTMIDYRVEIDPAETPRLTADRLVSVLYLGSGPGEGVRALSRAEERARYARSPLTDVDLATMLRDVRAALRHGVSWRTRLIAALLPPSLLARWRAGINARYAATSAVVGRRRDTLAKALSLRRLLASRTAR